MRERLAFSEISRLFVWLCFLLKGVLSSLGQERIQR